MDFEKEFPLRFCINLGYRQDRREDSSEQFAMAGIDAMRFPAVDSMAVRRLRGYESAGRYALALTQRLALRRATQLGAEAVLVFEDDVVFHPRFKELLKTIELPPDWAIFYFGCAHTSRPTPVNHSVVRVRYGLDTHAFAVRRPFFRRVIRALDASHANDVAHPRASDWFLANLAAELPVYACYPNLAWQAQAQSDLVAGTYSNYTAEGEQRHSTEHLAGLQGEMWGALKWNRPIGPEPAHDTPSASEACPVAPTRPSAAIKLGLLFLTRRQVNHSGIWKEFIDESNGGTRAFWHPKHVDENADAWLSRGLLGKRCDTEWGSISLVRAMLLLLKEGLSDETLTHFVFLSESCIPIKPWNEIRRRLSIDPRSMLFCENADSMKPEHRVRFMDSDNIAANCWRLHPQWCLLDRKVATLLIEEDFTEKFERMVAPDEHYFGTVLAARGFDIGSEINPLPVTWVKWEEVENENLTRPAGYQHVDDHTAREIAAFPGFFARKFPLGSDIARWRLHLADRG